jgi:hypothetical protein
MNVGTKCINRPVAAENISIHRAIAKYFSNSFVFKNELETEGLSREFPPALGAGGPGSQPGAPTIHNRQILQVILRTWAPARNCGHLNHA